MKEEQKQPKKVKRESTTNNKNRKSNKEKDSVEKAMEDEDTFINANNNLHLGEESAITKKVVKTSRGSSSRIRYSRKTKDVSVLGRFLIF